MRREGQDLCNRSFDICVIGGGIHGASVARDAALRGYKVVLLEKYDFASGTSSRSSKMLHGGVRYLEQGDFRLVKTALQERNYYINAAPHLSRVQQFFFPVINGRSRSAVLTRFGLAIYDLLSSMSGMKSKIPRHSVVSSNDKDLKALSSYGLNSKCVFSYYDGQMDDARIAIETVVDALELGVVACNYVPVTNIIRENGDWRVSWKNSLTNDEGCLSCKYLVNTAGPWVPEINLLATDSKLKAHYSRGTHLLFDREWNHPGLILPTNTKGRYYFVWPYFSPFGQSTLVGTTDIEVCEIEENPQPSIEEVEELLALLQNDLPDSGLNSTTLFGSFAGIRILGAKEVTGIKRFFVRGGSVSDRSREELIEAKDLLFTLVGGKYTSARKTAEWIVDEVDRASGYTKRETNLRRKSLTRALPGGVGYQVREVEELKLKLTERNLSRGIELQLSQELAQRAVCRFGMRAKELLDTNIGDVDLAIKDGSCMIEEVVYCLRREMAVTADDILRRRLGLTLENVSLVEINRVLERLGVPNKV